MYEVSTVIQNFTLCSASITVMLHAISYHTTPCHNGTQTVYEKTNKQVLNLKMFKSLWPSDAIWEHRTRSTLAQVMACCLTAPSHYLSQCWFTMNETRHTFQGNVYLNTQDSNPQAGFGIYTFKSQLHPPANNELYQIINESLQKSSEGNFTGGIYLGHQSLKYGKLENDLSNISFKSPWDN